MSSASGSSGSEMLFACTNCHKRCKFEDLSSTQQLCKTCRKKFPLVTCTYCRLEFHPIKNSANSRPACEHCARDFKQYGTPSFCSICNLQSAFNGKKCSRCVHSEKKYGPPVACDNCRLVCAFLKPEETKKKVGGKTLCLLCTINYKKAQFKKKTQEEKIPKPQKPHSTSKHKDHKDEEPSALKKMKLEVPSFTPLEATTSSQSLSLLGRDSHPLDLLSSNHLLETDKLQNEVSTLKKQVAQKEQALIEKDKMICQLRAETLDKEKDFRQKLQVQQRSHAEVVELLQADIRNLKKQLSQKGLSKSSTSTQGGVSTTSSLGSLVSTLSGASSS